MLKGMKRKTMLALFLALVLAFQMSVGAFAADEIATDTTPTAGTAGPTDVDNTTGKTIDVPTVLRLPVLKIEVGVPSTVVVNPYGLKYKVDTTDYTDQVINAPTTIHNLSGIGVQVTVTPTAKKGSTTDPQSVIIADEESLDAESATKKIKMNLKLIAGTESFVGTESNYSSATQTAAVVDVAQTDRWQTASITLSADGEATAWAGYKIEGQTAGKGATWGENDQISLSVAFKITAKLDSDKAAE